MVLLNSYLINAIFYILTYLKKELFIQSALSHSFLPACL